MPSAFMSPAFEGSIGQMSGSLVARVDSLIGTGIESAVVLKHRARLRRLGWSHALDPPADGPWVPGEPAPRSGCSVKLLIDGADALPEMAQAMLAARESVHITGWHIAPHFELERGSSPVVLGTLLAELAERIDVRVLVWAGAPIPAFHPTRGEVRAAVDTLVRGTRIRCEPDPREHPFHCHHEKTIVIDGKVAFVGGIDLTDVGGDRFDSSSHRARRQLGWHDAAVRLEGPVVADVAGHFNLRWNELTGERLEQASVPAEAGERTVQVLRTISDGMYDEVPRGDFSLFEGYVRALRSAERLIYLENQFLWAPEIVSILAEKLRHPPHPDFRLLLVLPARPNNGRDDTRGQLGLLAEADGGRGRLLAATIRSRSDGLADPLYVHAKVGIVDDRWLTVGSANLNAHSLFNDTELNVICEDPALARAARVRLWSEHLESDHEQVAAADAVTLFDERWRPIAYEQLERRQAGARPTHRLLAMPGVSRRSRRLLGPLEGLIDDG